MKVSTKGMAGREMVNVVKEIQTLHILSQRNSNTEKGQ